MKKFKVTKKVMALALCVVMCMASVLSVSAYSDTRYIANKITGELYATVDLYGSSTTFSIRMKTPKDTIGRNKYTTTCTAGANTYSYIEDENETFVYKQTVFSGQTSDLLIKKAYGYSRIDYVTFYATANGNNNWIADTFYIK